MTRLVMRDIRKRFGATVALGGVDLDVDAGRIHALVGENGAGKSTLMKILSGAIRPDTGRITLEGQPFDPRHPLLARRAGVAMIYQELSLANHLSVRDNITLGMEPTTFGILHRREIRRRAVAALDQLGQSQLDPRARVGDLSIAARQMVEVARALASGAKVLVLDEPTSSLSQHDAQQLFTVMRRLKSQGVAVIYISHFLEEVQALADQITVLRDGQSVACGPAGDFTAASLIQHMVGHRVDQLYPPRRPVEPPSEPPVLEVKNLTGMTKPIDVNLELHRGQVLGIAGLIGAGRSELLRAIFGLDPVRRGRVRVAGLAGPSCPQHRWRQSVGLLSEDRKQEGLAQSMTVADNLTLSHLAPFGRAGLVVPRRQHAAAAHWIERLKIKTAGPTQTLADLSGGNQQKVALARLLHHDVDVLLLDEPTRGIDVNSKAQIYHLIRQLAEQTPPKAVLMVSSYLPELLGVCDQIAVMSRGRLGPARPTDQWTPHTLMQAAVEVNSEKMPA